MTRFILKRLLYYGMIAGFGALIAFGLFGLASCFAVVIHHKGFY